MNYPLPPESVKGDMSKIAKELHTMTMQMENQGESQANAKGTSSTYADALNRQLPTSHASTLAWSHARNRQVLVAKTPDATANHLDNLDEGKLVEKVNEAITKMTRQADQHPNEVKVIRAKKLQNGGVVYKLNNLEAALWLCQEKVNFTKHFGESSVIKDRMILVISEYVPITHNPDALGRGKLNEKWDSYLNW